MTNPIYTPITVPFENTYFTSIRVDKIDYYMLCQLPMDENGISGFSTPQNEIQRDFERIILDDLASSLGMELKDMPHFDYKLPEFATMMHSQKVVCISHHQLTKVVLHFARKMSCEFCWGLLNASFGAELERINDSKWKCLKREEYYQSWVAKKGTVNRSDYNN
jgi:hypothetical protein